VDRHETVGEPRDPNRVVFLHRLIVPLVAALAVLLTPASAAAAGEPAGYGYFHTYAEVKAQIDDTVAAHPGIVQRFSMGTSYEGRPIWGVKVSDNVGSDEGEPEVFVVAQLHANERASGEMALYLMDLLVDGYGSDSRITDIVNSREIWIVPVANPDGAEYDMSDGVFRRWRKNRQPIPGSSYVGIDLNRQFGFKWNCCGGGSNNPSSPKYRGTEPWQAPETRAYRDFILSRVVGGQQQLAIALSIHAQGRLVLWPYAYTKKDHPPTMRYDDWRAFVALGRDVAALNGYRARQTSDLYVVDGDEGDWAYHAQGIFAFAFELAAGSPERMYPTLTQLQADQARNRPALLLLLEAADCPYAAVGAALAAKRCS
jgi:murein tripeptide amidase MpaA